ncbi:hypothetical protein IKF63_00565 [Candidatus Saccharibacteria bacterium]|nr:hypothetical protein [Candidatus Saccharibacteria bacterium]
MDNTNATSDEGSYIPRENLRGPLGGESVTHSGDTEVSSSITLDSAIYSSEIPGENALLVTGGDVTVNDPVITKTGDSTSENADFYGTNAAVLATDGTLNINTGAITTNGAYANGLFAYGSGKIIVKNTLITTNLRNSGGIMVAGGGEITAANLTVTTTGDSSAAIRSDRGGGVINVEGGSYKTEGAGSPAVYSTAEIHVKDGASLVSTASEGVVIEGSNQVYLEKSTLEDTNNTLHGNSETYKNIFIYQSMSGDAEEGTGTFSANNSKITTNKGDTFFITNTTAEIDLENNLFVNNDSSSAFLHAAVGKWGTQGNNGGNVKLSFTDQVAEGDIIVDSLSTVNFYLSDESFYKGTINGNDGGENVSVTIDEDSTIVLTGNSYINELKNADKENMNIYSNGYALYVNGTEVAVNGEKAPEVPEIVLDLSESTDGAILVIEPNNECTGSFFNLKCMDTKQLIPFIVGGISILVLLIILIAAIIMRSKKNKKNSEEPEPQISQDNPFRDTVTPVSIEETEEIKEVEVVSTPESAPEPDDSSDEPSSKMPTPPEYNEPVDTSSPTEESKTDEPKSDTPDFLK